MLVLINPGAIQFTVIPRVATSEDKDFDIPIMFLVGESDLIFPPNVIEEVAKLFTNATYHVIPEAAHASHFEQPDIFNTHLKSFLSSIM